MKIYVEGLSDRIIQLPLAGSRYFNFYADGNKVYYFGRGGTKVYDLEKQKEDVVADGATMSVTPGSKKAM